MNHISKNKQFTCSTSYSVPANLKNKGELWQKCRHALQFGCNGVSGQGTAKLANHKSLESPHLNIQVLPS